MVKQYYGVAIGSVLGKYITCSLENLQIVGYSEACHAGIDDIKNCVELIIAKGDFIKDTIKVFGRHGGQHTLRNGSVILVASLSKVFDCLSYNYLSYVHRV